MEEVLVTKTDNNHLKMGIYSLIFPTMMICILIIGITIANIFHFWIEDFYQQPLIISLLFGKEYAVSASWLIITSSAFLILCWYHQYLISNTKVSRESCIKRNLLNTLFVLFLIISLFYLVKIIYDFLSGSSDAAGLFRIFVTLLLNLLGIAYIILEFRQIKYPTPKMYLGVLSGIILVFNIIGLSISFKYASPTIMRTLRQDQQRVKDIKKISMEIKAYFKSNTSLPKSLEELKQVGLLQERDIFDPLKSPYVYVPKNNNTFSICTTFQRNSDEARRIRPNNNQYYDKGYQCQNYRVTKIEDGKYSLEIQASNNIRLRHDSYPYDD